MKISIEDARRLSLNAGNRIKLLYIEYWIPYEGNPPKEIKDIWREKFREIYNPSILWRPDISLPENKQYAIST